MPKYFAQGFEMFHTEPVDNRLVLSRAQMADMKKPQMPSVYLCVCSDDGKLYLYNENNPKIEETGRFRIVNFDEDSNTINTISIDQIKSLFQKEEEINGI